MTSDKNADGTPTRDIWLIGRIDQMSLLAAHFERKGRLIRWDSFFRGSNARKYWLFDKFLANRKLDPVLDKVHGRHLFPDVLQFFSKLIRVPHYNLMPSLIFASLARLFAPSNFKVLVGQGSYSFLAALYCRKKKKIFIADLTGQLPSTRYKQLSTEYREHGLKYREISSIVGMLRTWEIRLANYVFVPSQAVHDALLEMGIDRTKIRTLHYDAPLANILVKEPINPYIPGNTIKFLFVGRASIAKGIKYLLNGFSAAQKRSKNAISLTVVGWHENDAKNYIKANKDLVEFSGPVNKARLKTLYLDHDILILPSLSEGSALVTYEALAAGLPVISTTAGGSCVSHMDDGILINSRSAKDVTAAILHFDANPGEIDRMALEAKERHKKKMTKNYGQRTLEVIDSIIKLH